MTRYTRRRLLIGAGGLALGLAGYEGARVTILSDETPRRAFDVRRFGAAGDGRTNDTSAFQRAAAAITAAGGGDLIVPSGTYVVGRQRAAAPATPHRVMAEPIVSIKNCRQPVRIIGPEATLRAEAGLRFGSFDPHTGQPYQPPTLPFTDYDYRADAYVGMLALTGNHHVEVHGLELDGNSSALALGGAWGDGGRQCGASGIWAYGNRRLDIRGVHSHHHGLDGVTVGYEGLKASSSSAPHSLVDVRSEWNARQALSVVGAVGLTASRCRFSHTGKAGLASPPGAGVDIEAEHSVVRQVTLSDCHIVNNAGYGFIADSGDSAGITIRDSLVWGSTTGGALWPRRPGITFERCRVYGWVVNTFGSDNPAEATRFIDCRFEDRAHPRFGRPRVGLALLEFNGANVTLERCSVIANQTRSLLLAEAGTREVIRGCTIAHRFGGLPSGGYQAMIQGSVLEETSLRGEFTGTPRPAYYVSHSNVALGAGVRVEGPGLTWGPDGPVGLVKPG